MGDYWIERALASEDRLRLELSRTEILALLWRTTPYADKQKVSPLRCMLEEAVFGDFDLVHQIADDVLQKLLEVAAKNSPEDSDG
jgi:hypothetical protein